MDTAPEPTGPRDGSAAAASRPQTSDTPTSDTPTAEAPTSDTPTSEVRASEAPTSDTPTSDTPTSEVPTSDTPTSEAPTSDTPTSEAPTSEVRASERTDEQPSIADYALLSDCHSVALVSSRASIDWFCTPRIDSPAAFGRLLDPELGGSCRIAPAADVVESTRRYVDRTMVLDTTMRTSSGELRVRDCLAMRRGGRDHPRRELIRQATCVGGEVEVDVRIAARFDFGLVPAWVREHGAGRFTLVGGATGLAVWTDAPLGLSGRHDVAGSCRLRDGETIRLVVTTYPPEQLDGGPPDETSAEDADRHVDETIRWWRDWCDARDGGHDGLDGDVLRSALVLKSLVHAPTGAIAAAATTSLPEVPGGSWNWDYRFSWIRDSWMTVRSLDEAGFRQEADGFQRFVERSSAGSAAEFQLLYGVDGRHRTPEIDIPELSGYRGARPVREGNGAQSQLQLDMYGYLLELTWRRVERSAATIEPTYCRFLCELLAAVCGRWREPDHGIWELRGEPAHHVYSKVLCWTAVDRGVRLADAGHLGDGADVAGWMQTRDEIRDTILERGIRDRDGSFTAVLGGDALDASLLLIPEFGFVAPDDERFVATVDAIIDSLDDRGMIRRFRHADESATEGCFVACTFWLVERLFDLGRRDEAERYYERAVSASNDLGLFAEEYDLQADEPLGNFPQALSHLAHIGAALTFERGSSLLSYLDGVEQAARS